MKTRSSKKLRPDNNTDYESQSKNVGGLNSFLPSQDSNLAPIEEETVDIPEDHLGSVEFELLESPDSLSVMFISENVSPYFDFKFPLGSVCTLIVVYSMVYNNSTYSWQQLYQAYVSIQFIVHFIQGDTMLECYSCQKK